MKHPRFEILQDYFENVLKGNDEVKVKEHLLGCDQCTKVLADFVVIETKLQNQSSLKVSHNTRAKIFNDASSVLAERRAKIQAEQQRKEWLSNHLKEWKDNIFPELKIPALQLASLSLVLVVLVTAEKSQGTEEIFEPLTSDVTEFSAGE